MTENRLQDDGEGWPNGDPELEIFTIDRAAPDSVGVIVRCVKALACDDGGGVPARLHGRALRRRQPGRQRLRGAVPEHDRYVTDRSDRVRPGTPLRRALLSAVGVAAVIAVSGCGGDDDEVARADLIGFYDDIEFAVTSGGVVRVKDLGGDIDLSLEADGRTAGWLVVPEGVPEITDDGTGALETDLEGTWTFTAQRSRVAFDFDDDNFLEALPPFRVHGRFGGGVRLQVTGTLGDATVDITFVKD